LLPTAAVGILSGTNFAQTIPYSLGRRIITEAASLSQTCL